MRLKERHIKDMARLQEMKSVKWVRGMNIQWEQRFEKIRERLEDDGIIVAQTETCVDFIVEQGDGK